VGLDACESTEARPEQEKWGADGAEESEVEAAERKRATCVSGTRCFRSDDRRLAGRPLVALERRGMESAVYLHARVVPVQAAVVSQVGENPL
jgi:hypothetical protein